MRLDPGEEYVRSKMRLYFARMSTAMARICHGKAHVLTKDMKNIPHDGIWEQYERPTMVNPDKEDIPGFVSPPMVDMVSEIGYYNDDKLTQINRRSRYCNRQIYPHPSESTNLVNSTTNFSQHVGRFGCWEGRTLDIMKPTGWDLTPSI